MALSFAMGIHGVRRHDDRGDDRDHGHGHGYGRPEDGHLVPQSIHRGARYRFWNKQVCRSRFILWIEFGDRCFVTTLLACKRHVIGAVHVKCSEAGRNQAHAPNGVIEAR